MEHSQASPELSPDTLYALFEHINHSEAYQIAREGGHVVLPSMEKDALIRVIIGAEKAPPLHEHVVDEYRRAIMAFVIDHRKSLETQIKCPARSFQPDACFGCLDQQVYSCLTSTPEQQRHIQLYKRKLPQGDPCLMSEETVATAPLSHLTAPRDLHILNEQTSHTLRQLAYETDYLLLAENMVAWHRARTHADRAQIALNCLLEWDKKNPGKYQGVPVTTGPQPVQQAQSPQPQMQQPQYVQQPQFAQPTPEATAPMNQPPQFAPPQYQQPQQPQQQQQQQGFAPQGPPQDGYAQRLQQGFQPPQQGFAPPQQGFAAPPQQGFAGQPPPPPQFAAQAQPYPQQPSPQQFSPQAPPQYAPPPGPQLVQPPPPNGQGYTPGGFVPPGIVPPQQPVPQQPVQQQMFQGQNGAPQPAGVGQAAQSFAAVAAAADAPKRGRRSPTAPTAAPDPSGAGLGNDVITLLTSLRDSNTLLHARADKQEQLLQWIMSFLLIQGTQSTQVPAVQLLKTTIDSAMMLDQIIGQATGKG